MANGKIRPFLVAEGSILADREFPANFDRYFLGCKFAHTQLCKEIHWTWKLVYIG